MTDNIYPDRGVQVIPGGAPRSTSAPTVDIDKVLPATPNYVIDHLPRCEGTRVAKSTNETVACGRLLAEYAARPWSIQCRACKHVNRRGALPTTDGTLRVSD